MAAALHAAALGSAAVCGLMLLLWLIHLPLRNAAIVDAGWAGGLALLGVLYAFVAGGAPARAYLVAGMAALWGLRLGLYLLFTRVIGHPEEGRYVQLRREWGGNMALKFLLFFEAQALLCVLLSVAFLLPALNPSPELGLFEYAGASLWLVAWTGEWLSDWQLHRFKQEPAHRGLTCRAGLWRYSRHPNYFFEWLVWMAFAIYAMGSAYGWVAFFAPALMLYFLFRVTGIPATEAQALRSKGDDYRRYQQTTSAFVPWFPRSGA
jgi:steroid 5-alpha reductase family enzyme